MLPACGRQGVLEYWNSGIMGKPNRDMIVVAVE